MKKGWGFIEKVRPVLKFFGENGRHVKTAKIVATMGLDTKKQKKQLYQAISDLIKQGKARRVRPGVYCYVPAKIEADAENNEVEADVENSEVEADVENSEVNRKMWRVIRARRVVTIDDLVSLAGANDLEAIKCLAMLVDRETMKAVRGTNPAMYQLVKDTGPGEKRTEISGLDGMTEAAIRVRDAFDLFIKAMGRISRKGANALRH